MHQLTINPSGKSDNPMVSAFLDVMGREFPKDQQDAMVFYTHAGQSGCKYTYITTSKQNHLDLGRMTENVRWVFGEMIRNEFENHPRMTQMLLRTNDLVMLITKVEMDKKEAVFNIAPAGRDRSGRQE